MDESLSGAASGAEAEGSRCALCGRNGLEVSRHHLWPKSQSKRRARKMRGRARAEVREAAEQTAALCVPCHRMVHAVLSERDLAREHATVASLRAHPQIARFVKWISKQPLDRHVSVRWTHERRNGRPGGAKRRR